MTSWQRCHSAKLVGKLGFLYVVHYCLLVYLNFVVLLALEMHVDIRSRIKPVEPSLMSAVQCVALRIMEVVTDFLLKGEWTGDLIDKWKEAVQILETVVEMMPLQVSQHCPGIIL